MTLLVQKPWDCKEPLKRELRTGNAFVFPLITKHFRGNARVFPRIIRKTSINAIVFLFQIPPYSRKRACVNFVFPSPNIDLLLLIVFSGGLGYADVFSQKNDTFPGKRVCVFYPRKKRERKRVCVNFVFLCVS